MTEAAEETLATYLLVEGIKPIEFARLVPCSHTTVGRWLDGTRIPRPPHMERIRELTKGRVPPSSFYRGRNMAPPQAERTVQPGE